jgi:DNA-binding CsgD family transcriptional regulator
MTESDAPQAVFGELDSNSMLKAFEQASAFIAILQGPLHVYTLANAQYRKLMGDRHLIGLPVREAAPDVANQGFFEKLDHVFSTGTSYVARDIPLIIERFEGQPRDAFRINLLYSPIADSSGLVSGIFVEGTVICGPPGAMIDREQDSLLTPRELEVLHWSSQGKTADLTAAILGIAPRTVHHYMSRIIDKLDVDNHTHAVAEAFRRKIL